MAEDAIVSQKSFRDACSFVDEKFRVWDALVREKALVVKFLPGATIKSEERILKILRILDILSKTYAIFLIKTDYDDTIST